MEKFSWTDLVKNEVLHRVNEENLILHARQGRKANWTGHIFRRNCLLKHVIVGNIEGTRREVRRCKRPLEDFKVKIRETERGSTRSHSLEDSLWKKLWTSRKTD